jgi:dolichol-phosphate mannosyltransferase
MTTPRSRPSRARPAKPARPVAGPVDAPETAIEPPLGSGTWVVLPTYNEADNLRSISAAILESLPGATLLVVDDGSPDGTGTIADELVSADPRVRVQHRGAKQGLGRAYLDGFGVALAGGAVVVVQMDADWSHDPTSLPALIGPLVDEGADLVIGSRYTVGGGVVDWGFGRRIISRGGSVFAKTVLRLGPNDLTGGFKAWRATTLAAIPFDGVHAGGYVFQIEMTFRAARGGARIREVPITFRDRRVGQSKMSRRIVVEALVVVVTLRFDELIGRLTGRLPHGVRPIRKGAADAPPEGGIAEVTATGSAVAQEPSAGKGG